MLELYYERLTAGGRCNPEKYTFENCWNDYKYLGAAALAKYVIWTNLGLVAAAPARQIVERYCAFV